MIHERLRNTNSTKSGNCTQMLRTGNQFVSLLKVSSCTVKRYRHHVIWKYNWTPVYVKIQIIINTKSMHRLQTNESKDKPNIVFSPIA